jgi:transcriptional regulator with XRE-family HTH domain
VAQQRHKQFVAWGLQLKRERERRGFTPRQVAKLARMGWAPDQVTFFEQGKLNVTREDVSALCDSHCFGNELKRFDHLLPEDVRMRGGNKVPAPTTPPPAPPPPAKPDPMEAVRTGVVKLHSAVEHAPADAPPPGPLPRFKTFAEHLRVARGEMSPRELAKQIGVTPKTIQNYETGLGVIELFYDRLVAIFPQLKDAPKPRFAKSSFASVPGKRRTANTLRFGDALKKLIAAENGGRKGGPGCTAVPTLASILKISSSTVHAWMRGEAVIWQGHYDQLIQLYPALKEAPVPELRQHQHEGFGARQQPPSPPSAPVVAQQPVAPPPPPPPPPPPSALPAAAPAVPKPSADDDLITAGAELAALMASLKRLRDEAAAVEAKIPGARARVLAAAAVAAASG